MKQEDFEKLQNNMKEKLGETNFALISDDVATLMSENNSMNTQISERDTTIKKLNQDKSNLIETNGNLMQKISKGVPNCRNLVFYQLNYCHFLFFVNGE